MNTNATTQPSLSRLQADILRALHQLPDGTRRDMRRLVPRIAQQAYASEVTHLLQQGLLTTTQPHSGSRPERLAVTHAGRNALAHYLSTHQSGMVSTPCAVADARRINVLLGNYTPPASAYYRNSGHKHIASFGVRC